MHDQYFLASIRYRGSFICAIYDPIENTFQTQIDDTKLIITSQSYEDAIALGKEIINLSQQPKTMKFQNTPIRTFTIKGKSYLAITDVAVALGIPVHQARDFWFDLPEANTEGAIADDEQIQLIDAAGAMVLNQISPVTGFQSWLVRSVCPQ